MIRTAARQAVWLLAASGLLAVAAVRLGADQTPKLDLAAQESEVPCDADGMAVGYTAAFRPGSDAAYVVTQVTARGIAHECRGFDLVVNLTEDGVPIGDAGPVVITADEETLEVTAPPPAKRVNDVHVAVTGDRVPPECRDMSKFDHVVLGGDGDDELSGGNAKTLVLGFGGNDVLTGGRAPDCLSGGEGDDLLEGGNGPDVLIGGSGYDICNGGAGPDTYIDCEEEGDGS